MSENQEMHKIPTGLCQLNVQLWGAQGYPVLSKAHQAIVKGLLKYDPQFVLKGNPAPGYGISAHMRYLAALHALAALCAPIAIVPQPLLIAAAVAVLHTSIELVSELNGPPTATSSTCSRHSPLRTQSSSLPQGMKTTFRYHERHRYAAA